MKPAVPGRVSVIVAVFNGVHTLQRCIDSVVAQGGSDVELIIVDGGSTDGTKELVEANAAKLAHWESRKDRGVYHAWNKALSRATGSWISFLGADDAYASDDAVAALVGAASPDSNLVFGKVDLIDRDGAVVGTLGVAWEWEQMKRRQTVAHPGSLQARALFEQLGPFSEHYAIAGDYEFLLRVGRAARPAFIDRVVVRFSNDGLSTQRYEQTLRETRDIKRRHAEIGWTAAWAHYAYDRARFEARKALPAPLYAGLKALRGSR